MQNTCALLYITYCIPSNYSTDCLDLDLFLRGAKFRNLKMSNFHPHFALNRVNTILKQHLTGITL